MGMKNVLMQYLAVGVAGFLGAVTRLAVGQLCLRWVPGSFPVGTMLINVSGSFVLGWFLGWAGTKAEVSDTLRLAVAVGFVGSYTTFSTLMHDSNRLFRSSAEVQAAVNLGLSLALGLAAVRLGAWWAGR